jgi:hypothetical protein
MSLPLGNAGHKQNLPRVKRRSGVDRRRLMDIFLLDTAVELAISFPRRSFCHAFRMALCETS